MDTARGGGGRRGEEGGGEGGGGGRRGEGTQSWDGGPAGSIRHTCQDGLSGIDGGRAGDTPTGQVVFHQNVQPANTQPVSAM